MVTVLGFWFKNRRRAFTACVLSVIVLSLIFALFTSGSNDHVVVVRSMQFDKQQDVKDFDQWLNDRFDYESETAQSVKMASTDNEFNAEKILSLFTECRGADNILSIDCYVDAYQELCKLFHLFGTVFGFVTSDVVEKIGILRDYRISPEAHHYATIQDMITYEVQQGKTANKKKASGSRTLLRLHRALEFISALLGKIREADGTKEGTKESVKFSSLACKAYDDTLAKHHPWLIKKAVHLAMYALPSRQDLLKKMCVEDNEQGMKGLSDLIKELNIIYDITQERYAKDDLLNLP